MGKEKDEEALPSGVLSSSRRSSPAAADVGEGGVRDEEDVAADKLPSEQRKTRKRRKNGRQAHHFQKRRQAEHFLHLKMETGREPPLRRPVRRDEKEDVRRHRQRLEDARKERRRKCVGEQKNSTSEPERQMLPPLERCPRQGTRKMR